MSCKKKNVTLSANLFHLCKNYILSTMKANQQTNKPVTVNQIFNVTVTFLFPFISQYFIQTSLERALVCMGDCVRKPHAQPMNYIILYYKIIAV